MNDVAKIGVSHLPPHCYDICDNPRLLKSSTIESPPNVNMPWFFKAAALGWPSQQVVVHCEDPRGFRNGDDLLRRPAERAALKTKAY